VAEFKPPKIILVRHFSATEWSDIGGRNYNFCPLKKLTSVAESCHSVAEFLKFKFFSGSYKKLGG